MWLVTISHYARLFILFIYLFFFIIATAAVVVVAAAAVAVGVAVRTKKTAKFHRWGLKNGVGFTFAVVGPTQFKSTPLALK